MEMQIKKSKLIEILMSQLFIELKNISYLDKI